jgi:hypothetical protein
VNATGTSSTSKSYSFTDAKPVLGKNYYRLKFYDDTNKEFIYKTVSATVSLLATETEIENGITVFPNPLINSSFYINTTDRLSIAPQLLDATGKSLGIEIEILDTSKSRISVKQNLDAGVYFLVVDKMGYKVVKKLIVP